MKIQLVALYVCLSISSVVFARGIIREDAQLVGGTATVGLISPFPSIVQISVGCTATKVGQKTFLTAAHCVFDFAAKAKNPLFTDGASLQITNLPNPHNWLPWATVTIETTVIDPDFLSKCSSIVCDDSSVDSALDVAVFRVNEDTPLLPLSAVDYRFVLPGDPVFIMGYGCEVGAGPSAPQGVPGDPTLPNNRLKYQATRIASDSVPGSVGIPPLSPIHLFNFFTAGQATDPTSASTCPGDSGGPVILNLPDGRYVVGVNSAGYGDSATDASPVNQHARLSKAVTWMPAQVR